MKRVFTFFAAVSIICGMYAQHVELNPNFVPTRGNMNTNMPKDGDAEITWLTSQTEATAFGNSQSTFNVTALMEFTVNDISDWNGEVITSISQISFFISAGGLSGVNTCSAVILQGATIQSSTEVVTQEVANVQSGWNNISLDNNYMVNPGQNLYIGYKLNATNCYPLSVASCSNSKQGHLNWNGTWDNLSSSGAYGFLIKATAYLGEPEALAIRMESIEMPATAFVGDILEVNGVVKNVGTDPITQFDASYTVNGITKEQQFTGLNIAPGAGYNLEFTETYELTEPIEYTLEVTLSNPNGEADNEIDNTQSGAFSVLSEQHQRKVMLEGFSASTCGPCAGGNVTLHNVLNQADADTYVLMKNQMNWPGAGDPYYTTEGDARRTYYNVSSVPDMAMDGATGYNTNAFTLAMLNGAVNVPAKAKINVTAVQSGQTVTANISATLLTEGNENIRLIATIAEKHTTRNIGTNGEKAFFHVMKKFMTTTSGQALPVITANTPFEVDLEYTFNGNYLLPANAGSPINHATEHSVEGFDDLEVIVWIQNTTTKEVWQAGRADAVSSDVNYTVTFEQPENGTLTVTNSGETVNSGDMLPYGTELIITATPAEGYQIDVLTVNGADFTSGNTHTVTGDVTIVCTTSSGISNNTLSGIDVYSKGSTVNIVNDSNIALQSVQVIDMTGRTVYVSKAAVTSNVININAASGHYVVKVIAEDGKVATTKVYLSK
ncbi:MAG: T9SS type A sorting domain-containing protein [Cytophagaceae bacterium]|jgi:hypothetical protein|nr:T9SS type A sorting domain-containing protein [Cytophagaceae bacterium]